MNVFELRRRLMSKKENYNLINVDKFVELVKQYYTKATLIEVDGRRCIKVSNSVLHGKDFTMCCPTFKEKTRYIFSFEARPETTSTGLGYLYMGFKPSSSTPSKYLAPNSDQFKRIYNINNANTTVTDIYFSYGNAYNWLIDLETLCLYEYDKFLELGGTTMWG